MAYLYQWEELYNNRTPKKTKFQPKFGPIVIERKNKIASKVKFQLLVDSPNEEIFIVGKFNDWGKDKTKLKPYKLTADSHSIFYSISLTNIKHKDEYMFLQRIKHKWYYRQDPAGHYFSKDGNTMFWDFEDPSTYKQKHNFINTFDRATKIMQTDLPGLFMHFRDKKGRLGHQIPKHEYYKFITESGILEHVKSLGFNTIQFLPFAQSIDGDNWKFRYLVPFQYAIQKNWGTPDEFARMIDKAHELDLAIIGDFVIAHLPFKDYSIFGRKGEDNGIHVWMNRHNVGLYMREETPWGTMRIDYESEHVRRFIVESCLHYQDKYKIDGFRIDNVDGIIRYGHSGDGEERPHGRTFLKELHKEIYNYNPGSLIHLESHYYMHDNAKMLVVPFETDNRALAATAYNSSRATYFFHTDFMPKAIEKIDIWRLRDIIEEKEWGQSNSTIADFHNHDAAAGLMENRCTGSYCYDTMTCKQPQNHFHAVGKIKVMESLIAFMHEGRILDLMQTFLLQTGTFEHDSSIHWHLTYSEVNRNMVNFKVKINEILEDPAFFPINTKNRKFLNVDEKNKIIVLERKDTTKKDGSSFIIIVNLSSWKHMNYRVGLTDGKAYELIFNSDKFHYSGTGQSSYPDKFQVNPSKSFELLDKEIQLDVLSPYGVVVLKKL